MGELNRRGKKVQLSEAKAFQISWEYVVALVCYTVEVVGEHYTEATTKGLSLMLPKNDVSSGITWQDAIVFLKE